MHTVILSNPSYHPLQKKILIEPGKVTTLVVDLGFEAFPK
jgi:hypothetical protein